jgi:hypothetical protein
MTLYLNIQRKVANICEKINGIILALLTKRLVAYLEVV